MLGKIIIEPVIAQTNEQESQQHFAAVSALVDEAADEATQIQKLNKKEKIEWTTIQTKQEDDSWKNQEPVSPTPTPPTQTTIFLVDPNTILTAPPTTSEEIYYSETPVTFDITTANKVLQEMDENIASVLKKISDLDKKFKSTDTKYPQIKNEVMQLINDMKKTKKELEEKLENITKYQRVILQAGEQITTIRKDITNIKQHIVDFSNLLYRVYNELYNKQGKIDDIKLFFQSDANIADTLSSTYIIENMIAHLNKLIIKLQWEETRQINRIKASNKYKLTMKEEIQIYQEKIRNLEQKRKYLSDYLDLYATNKSKIERTSISLLDTRRDIQKAIADTINEIRQKKYIVIFNMSGKLGELRNLEPYATYERSAPLSWPILPVKYISTYFKDPVYKEKYDLEHYGIEIPSPQNTPVYAAADGIVYRIQQSEDFGVNWMLIVHSGGMITVYQYMNNFYVNEWDIVRRWQLLGTSGGEPGTKGAWFISRQPNLTFMVFDKTKFVDPLSVLDLSPISNQSLLEQKYHIKYLKDLYARARDIYKIEFMTGETLNERRVQFLETYGVGIYRELAFWQDAAAGTNIDLDVGICIAFAESTLGNYLTTPNNVGNVGNNDRWDRVSFGTALAGARMIYETLNNAYLWKYNTIIELNGYGNKNGPKYATSPYNWQNNVIACLSKIKGYYVPDDYPFRIGPNPNKREEKEQKKE